MDYRTRFERDGFFALPPVMSPEALAWADGTVEAVIAAHLAHTDRGRLSGIAVTEAGGRRHVVGIPRIYDHLGGVALYLLGLPRVAEVARAICGAGAIPTHDWMVIKSAGDDQCVLWHQDFAHDGRHPALNIGIHLDGAEEDAVRFIPDSRSAEVDLADLGARYDYATPGLGVARVAPGGLTVHDVLLVHGSPPLQRQARRKTLYIEFRDIESLRGHPTLPPEYVTLRARLFAMAQERYRRHGERPGGEAAPLDGHERELLAALDALQVRLEPARYAPPPEAGPVKGT